MADRFQNKYRIPPARAQWWNYSNAAAYFITVCTTGMHAYFGKIAEGQMILSEIGSIVSKEWEKTFEMRPDMNLEMGEYVVMPNHFHAIIIIGHNQYNVTEKDEADTVNRFGPQSKNLPSIVRGFKIGVTQQARLHDKDFSWQPRFHEHIIRDAESYDNISNYIINNPEKWHEDRFFQL